MAWYVWIILVILFIWFISALVKTILYKDKTNDSFMDLLIDNLLFFEIIFENDGDDDYDD